MSVAFVDLARQDREIRDSVRDAALGVLDRGDFVLGRAIGQFEEAFAAYCGSKHAVGVGSGLAALELILRAYGVGPGDEVIVPAHTFVATASAVSITGATPVLADVSPETYTLDPAAAEAAVTPATRAILGVHLYGRPFELAPLRRIADRFGLALIEDAAQAHGATLEGRRTGALGDAAAFSFYPTKNLGASGDAGMVTTDDAVLARRIGALSNCGQTEKNVHAWLPLNHRMDTLHAAVLQVRLPHLEAWNAGRRAAAQRYREALAGLPVGLPPEDEADRRSVYHVFVVQHDDRDGLAAYLGAQGIGTGIHYPKPVHLQPAFASLGYGEGSFPVAESVAARVLSLPMHPMLTHDEVAHVADAVRGYAQAEASAASTNAQAR